jgi:hypothetical protein
MRAEFKRTVTDAGCIHHTEKLVDEMKMAKMIGYELFFKAAAAKCVVSAG